MGSIHPRRFSIKRDMSTGLYDVWDALRQEYVACDVRYTAAERALNRARSNAVYQARYGSEARAQ